MASSTIINYLRENAWAQFDFSAPLHERRKLALQLLLSLAVAGGLAGLVVRHSTGAFGWHRALLIWSVAVVLALALVLPIAGRATYRVLMGAAGLLALLMNLLALSVAFYLVFTPVGIGARLLGRDFLNRRKKNHAAGQGGMWRDHRPTPPPASYHHLS